MSKKTTKQRQRQRQKQTLTNIIKIALDRKKSSGRRRSTPKPTQKQPQMDAQQALLTQLLTNNQPQRLGYSLLERQVQDDKMRNLEMMLKSAEQKLKSSLQPPTTNPILTPSFSRASMIGPTAPQLFKPEKPEPPVGRPLIPQEPPLRLMRDFLKENIRDVPNPRPGRKRGYTKKEIATLDDDIVRQLYRETFTIIRAKLDDREEELRREEDAVQEELQRVNEDYRRRQRAREQEGEGGASAEGIDFV